MCVCVCVFKKNHNSIIYGVTACVCVCVCVCVFKKNHNSIIYGVSVCVCVLKKSS